MTPPKIKTVLIDDNKEYLFALRENLSLIPEIEIVGEANQYPKAKQLLIKKQPELIFLDIEMPCKNGFELLDEIRLELTNPFKVIFYTAYDKYMIEALRQSAFDYLVKPAELSEIRTAVERFIKLRNEPTPLFKPATNSPFVNMMALPVSTGLRFVDRYQVVLFHCHKEGFLDRSVWEVTLSTGEKLKLKQNLSASQIIDLAGEGIFLKLNKATLVNKNFISLIEYKTRVCQLIPPFNDLELNISRQQLTELRDQLDLV